MKQECHSNYIGPVLCCECGQPGSYAYGGCDCDCERPPYCKTCWALHCAEASDSSDNFIDDFCTDFFDLDGQGAVRRWKKDDQ